MRHQIIVLGRQFGSGGRQVGRKLAAALNVPCYDREIITMAAERAELGADFFEGKDEKRTNPWLYESVYRGGPRVKWGQSAEEILAQMEEEVIRSLAAKEDCILVGRRADVVLQDQDVDVLSMFICAPLDWRIRRRMELDHLDERQAAKLIQRMDKQRKRYYEHYAGRPWGIPQSYDMCVNSARLGVDKTAALLASHWRLLKSET